MHGEVVIVEGSPVAPPDEARAVLVELARLRALDDVDDEDRADDDLVVVL